MTDISLAELKNSDLREPVLLRHAPYLLRHASTAWPVDSMVILREAINAGMVRSARVRVPGMGIQTFVDGETVEKEVSAYWARVAAGEVSQPVAELALQESRRRMWTKRALRSPLVLRAVRVIRRRPKRFLRTLLRSPFWPVQRVPEISALMGLVAERRPRFVLEIGTGLGGTICIWTAAAHRRAVIATVDIRQQYDAKLLRSFARWGQRVVTVIGDSRGPETIARIRDLFPNGVDFLFIDGDHSYEGVTSDYEIYEPMVRAGGLIACHDIVEDNRTRYGINTGGRAGGVPEFWKWIKSRCTTREFIENDEQDGAGIGVIFKPSR